MPDRELQQLEFESLRWQSFGRGQAVHFAPDFICKYGK
jgi:hypothetical protein